MQDLDLVIKGGTVVTASDTTICDIGVKDGKVVALAQELSSAKEVINAEGLLVLPGGIEAHCHIDEPPLGKVVSADDIESGSRAAACGGNTMFIPFANQLAGESLFTSVDDYHERARGKSYIDYSFHMIVSNPTEDVLANELPTLIKDGISSFKVFMSYSDVKLEDNQILDVLAVARENGALVMIHAENDHCINWLTKKLKSEGKVAPKYFLDAHSDIVEREATHRAISLAEIVDTPVLIVHVSSAQTIEQIKWARERGINIYAETCPQYLFLSEHDFDKPGWEAAKFICAPPPRDLTNQQRLMKELKAGTFNVFHSDHCPYNYEGDNGKQYHAHEGGHPHFCHVAPGIPGIETRLPLLFSEGVVKGEIDLNHFVALTSTNAAKLYGLYPQKGTIAIGSDADFAIWDPNKSVTIEHKNLHDNCDYSPYEGFAVQGWPIRTILRGQTIWHDGEIIGEAGDGHFIKRSLFDKDKPFRLM